MKIDRRMFILAAGRFAAVGALTAASARLLLCRRSDTNEPYAGTCPPCPWRDLCPARSGSPAPSPESAGDSSHG